MKQKGEKVREDMSESSFSSKISEFYEEEMISPVGLHCSDQ